MKQIILKTVIIIIISLLYNCKPKPKPLSVYVLKIERENLEFMGLPASTETVIDTIRALNDTAAYREALTTYYSHKIAEKTAKVHIYKTHSFSLQDSTRMYIELLLTQKVKDSLENSVKDGVEGVMQSLGN